MIPHLNYDLIRCIIFAVFANFYRYKKHSLNNREERKLIKKQFSHVFLPHAALRIAGIKEKHPLMTSLEECNDLLVGSLMLLIK